MFALSKNRGIIQLPITSWRVGRPPHSGRAMSLLMVLVSTLVTGVPKHRLSRPGFPGLYPSRSRIRTCSFLAHAGSIEAAHRNAATPLSTVSYIDSPQCHSTLQLRPVRHTADVRLALNPAARRPSASTTIRIPAFRIDGDAARQR